jgi:3-dehydro-L-gulonate 2-dehydrogenase
MRITKEHMQQTFSKILQAYGFSESDANTSSELFVMNSLDGVYSHGVNRFPRVISYLEKGYIKPEAKPSVELSFGSMERWNGNLAMGNIVAKQAMERAIQLAKQHGIGCVAIRNTNHWMRGGTYGWQAADAGFIGMCFTNTQPNMPAWGAKDRRIGNNPFVLAIPRENGEHIVVDCAMAQYSYGKIEEAKLGGKNLPYPGGFDEEGNLTTDPSVIEKTWRVLPIGYWKGSSLSIAFDLIAAVLSGGNTVSEIGKLGGDEFAVSQVVLAIDPYRFGGKEEAEEIINLEFPPGISNNKRVRKRC